MKQVYQDLSAKQEFLKIIYILYWYIAYSLGMVIFEKNLFTDLCSRNMIIRNFLLKKLIMKSLSCFAFGHLLYLKYIFL